MSEIGIIMGLESVDTNTPGWFIHRTTATKNILCKMSEAEKDNLRNIGKEMAETGMPEDLQRK